MVRVSATLDLLLIPVQKRYNKWFYNFRESDENIKYNMIQDPVTGKAEQTFRTPYTLQHKIGGLVQVSSPLK